MSKEGRGGHRSDGESGVKESDGEREREVERGEERERVTNGERKGSDKGGKSRGEKRERGIGRVGTVCTIFSYVSVFVSVCV